MTSKFGGKCSNEKCKDEICGRGKNLDILERANQFEVGNVNKSTKGAWEKIEATVDSGAADTVGPASMAQWVPLQETAASKAGLQYNAADGGVINNLGEKDVAVMNDNFAAGGITVQICDKVNNFFAAVSQIGKAGNKITFYDDDGRHRIVNKVTGEETPSARRTEHSG